MTIKRILSLLLVVFLLPWNCFADTLMLPAGVQIISDSAFEGDTSLDEVVLPDGVKSIGSRAFADSSVGHINLPDSLEYIADDAFDGADNSMFYAEWGTYAFQWMEDHHILLRFTDEYCYDASVDMAIVEADDEIGLYDDPFAYYFELADVESWAENLNGKPSWSVNQIEGPGTSDYYLAENGPYAASLIVEMPEKPCTRRFEVVCEWDGLKSKALITVNHVYPASLPNGATTEDSYVLTPNQDNVISLAFAPADYAFGNADRVGLEDYTGEADWWWEGHDLHIVPHNEGVFTGYIALYAGNMYIWREVTFSVGNYMPGLRAEAIATDWYRLSWEPVEGANSYTVSCYSDPECTELYDVQETTDTSILFGTDIGDQYWFVLDDGDPVTADPIEAMAEPSNLEAVVDENGTVHLTWDSSADAYRIYYSNQEEWTRETEWFSGVSGNEDLWIDEGEVKYIWVCVDNGNGPNYLAETIAIRDEDVNAYIVDKDITFASMLIEDMGCDLLSTKGVSDPEILSIINEYNSYVTEIRDNTQAFNNSVNALNDAAQDFLSLIRYDGKGFFVENIYISNDVIDLLSEGAAITEYEMNDGVLAVSIGTGTTVFISEDSIGTEGERVSYHAKGVVSSSLSILASALSAAASAFEGNLNPRIQALNELNRAFRSFARNTGRVENAIIQGAIKRAYKASVNRANRLARVARIARTGGKAFTGFGAGISGWSIGDDWRKMRSLDDYYDHLHPTLFEENHSESNDLVDELLSQIDAARLFYRADQVVNAISIGSSAAFLAAGPGGWAAGFGTGVVTASVSYVFSEIADNCSDYAHEIDEILHFEVSGIVQDKNTKKIIEGVEVVCVVDGHEDMTSTTDYEGKYYFEPLSNAVHLTFHKDGYIDLPISLPEKGKEIEKDVPYYYNAVMETENGKLYGTVKDESGKPIEGVKVTCGEWSDMTDAKGEYTLEPLPGTYNVNFYHQGHKEENITAIIQPRGDKQVNMSLRNYGAIRTRADLEAIDSSGEYYLCNSISLSGADWMPLSWFSGTLDGCGYTIYGMSIHESTDGNVGLFSGLNGATIKNLSLFGDIDVSANSDFTNVGLIAGNSLSATLTHCIASGSISINDGTANGMVFAGGLIGLGKAKVSDSASEVDITTVYKSDTYVGGLIGRLESGSISDSSFDGKLSVAQSSSKASAQYLAVGTTYSEKQVMQNCFTGGTIEVSTDDGFAHACGLGMSDGGKNTATVMAVSATGGAMASGCELSTNVVNEGTVSAKGRGSVYAVGIAGSGSRNCENYGDVQAECDIGDGLAVGVCDCDESVNEGNVTSTCGRGNAIGQAMTNCDYSVNRGTLTVTYQGTDGRSGGLSAHGIDDCVESQNEGDITGIVERSFTNPTVAGIVNGTNSSNSGEISCVSASGPAVVYGVKGAGCTNTGPVRAQSTGNDSTSKEAYATASGIAEGSSECDNTGLVAAVASYGGARAYGYAENCANCTSVAGVSAITTYLKQSQGQITRGAAYAYNSTLTMATTQDFTVTAENGESWDIYYVKPACSTHEGMPEGFVAKTDSAGIDGCYHYLGGAYSIGSTD